jgi:transketolase
MKDQLMVLEKINNFAINCRKNILDMALAAGANSSHFGGALSIVEILSTLFSTQIRLGKDNLNSQERDRFILSKGHACLAYYAALCEVGFIKKEELKTFEKNDSNLLGHPVLNKSL